MQELVKPKLELPKTTSKPLTKFSFSLSTLVSGIMAAYLVGSFNPIQKYIPIEIHRTNESIGIEWKFK